MPTRLLVSLLVCLLLGCDSENASPDPILVSAGPDRVLNEQQAVQLLGLAVAPNGGRLQPSWRQVLGPTAQIQNADRYDPIIQLPEVSVGSTETLEFRLTVQNEAGESQSDEVAIDVVSQDVVFGLQRSDPAGVHLVLFDPETDSTRQLSPLVPRDVGTIPRFSVSPDGKAVAYVVQSNTSPQLVELFIANAESSSVVSVTGRIQTPRATDVCWSPTGERLVFVSDFESPGRPELYVASRDGSQVSRIESGPSNLELFSFSCSNDGRYIAISKRRATPSDVRVYVYDALAPTGDASTIEVFRTARVSRARFVWSQSSDRLAIAAGGFFIFGTDLQPGELWVVNADGANLRRLTDLGPDDINTDSEGRPLFSWSSTGNYIALRSLSGRGDRSLMIVPTDGNRAPFTVPFMGSETFRLLTFVWSSFGDRIAFAVNSGLGVFDADTGESYEQEYSSWPSILTWLDGGTTLFFSIRGERQGFALDSQFQIEARESPLVFSVSGRPVVIDGVFDFPFGVFNTATSLDGSAVFLSARIAPPFESRDFEQYLVLRDRGDLINLTSGALNAAPLLQPTWWPLVKLPPFVFPDFN
ncbi:MAG: hypothetical protein AAGL69_04420 [Pseudomonadota bacterium]